MNAQDVRDKVNGWKGYIIAVLTTVLVTAGTAWFTLGQGITRVEAAEIARQVVEATAHPTRQEVSSMIQTEAPFVPYRSHVDRLNGQIDRLTEVTTNLAAQLAELRGEIRAFRNGRGM